MRELTTFQKSLAVELYRAIHGFEAHYGADKLDSLCEKLKIKRGDTKGLATMLEQAGYFNPRNLKE